MLRECSCTVMPDRGPSNSPWPCLFTPLLAHYAPTTTASSLFLHHAVCPNPSLCPDACLSSLGPPNLLLAKVLSSIIVHCQSWQGVDTQYDVIEQMNVWMDRWMDGWVHGCMDGWVHGCMGRGAGTWVSGWVGGWMDGWVDRKMEGHEDGWGYAWVVDVSFVDEGSDSEWR